MTSVYCLSCLYIYTIKIAYCLDLFTGSMAWVVYIFQNVSTVRMNCCDITKTRRTCCLIVEKSVYVLVIITVLWEYSMSSRNAVLYAAVYSSYDSTQNIAYFMYIYSIISNVSYSMLS